MSILENIHQLFFDKKFDEAWELLSKALSKESSFDSLLELHKLQVRISLVLDRSGFVQKSQYELANFLEENKYFKDASDIYEKLYNDYNSSRDSKLYTKYELLKKIWWLLLQDGCLAQALDVSYELLDYLFLKKHTEKIEIFLNELQKTGTWNDQYKNYQIKLYLLKNDQEQILKYLFLQEPCSSKDYEQLIDFITPDLLKQTIYGDYLFAMHALSLQSENIAESKKIKFAKKIINILIGRLLKDGPTLVFTFLACLYSKKLGKKELLGHSIRALSFVAKKEQQHDKVERFLSQCEEEVNALIENLDRKEIIAQVLLELGKSSTGDVNEMTEVLTGGVSNEGVIETEFKQDEMLIENDSCSIFAVIEEITKKRYDSSGFELNQKAILKYFLAMDDLLLLKSYKDIVVTFLTMNLADVAEGILEKISTQIMPDDTHNFFEFVYLKTNSLMIKKDFVAALCFLDDILASKALLEEEIICFYYLRAEILVGLTKRDEAYYCYKKVYELDPAYRLVAQRLKDFEKN